MTLPSLSRRASPALLTALACCALLLAAGCGRKNAGSQAQGGVPPAPEVAVMTVEAEPVAVTTELPGRLEAVRVAEVRARATGILLRRLFEEGAEVKAGDVLFEIDPAPLRAAEQSARANLARAQANLNQARATAGRSEALIAVNAISREQYDISVAALGQAEAEVNAAQAQLDVAALNLGYAKVEAPISGRIGRALVTEGALVSQAEATRLAVIQQLDPIYFDFSQSSVEVLRLRRDVAAGRLQSISPGEAKVSLLLEDGSVDPHPGRLLFRDVSVDPTTGMVTLRAEFPNPDRLLLPGMFVRGRLQQAVNTNAITVPQRAVSRGPNGAAVVMVVTPENKVEQRALQTGAALADKWVVNSGLAPGEQIIVEGTQRARPGMTVRPVPFRTGQPATPRPPTPGTEGT